MRNDQSYNPTLIEFDDGICMLLSDIPLECTKETEVKCMDVLSDGYGNRSLYGTKDKYGAWKQPDGSDLLKCEAGCVDERDCKGDSVCKDCKCVPGCGFSQMDLANYTEIGSHVEKVSKLFIIQCSGGL